MGSRNFFPADDTGQEELSENGNRLKDFPEDVRDAVLRIMEKIKGDDYNMDEVLDMDITQSRALSMLIII